MTAKSAGNGQARRNALTIVIQRKGLGVLAPTLEHAIASKTGRETKINGDLRVHLN